MLSRQVASIFRVIDESSRGNHAMPNEFARIFCEAPFDVSGEW
jgi:hypothetical protein